MFSFRQVLLIVAGGLALDLDPCQAAAPIQREPNTTLSLPQNPPSHGYAVTNAFGSLTFTNPIHIVSAPGETNRLFILERAGRVTVITNLAEPTRTVFIDRSLRVLTDAENGLLGMAFHPGFQTNRFFYLFYSTGATTTNLQGTANLNRRTQRVSRFEASQTNPNFASTNTELPLITQPDDDSSHNAGDLAFGPDGYLYIAVGDEGGFFDFFNNSQRIDLDFHSGILRIDVDKRPGSLVPRLHTAHLPSVVTFTNSYGFQPGEIHYSIPPDNPFVGATVNPNGTPVDPSQLRDEFWAVGLRNPFRMSFDKVTGTLYSGDVGESSWEEINVITRGGNYGWAFREGPEDTYKAPNAPPGFTSIPPIIQLSHRPADDKQRAAAVIGGVVYRGNNMPALYGKYIFADHMSGNVWAATPRGTNQVSFDWLLQHGVVAMGTDPRNGDVLFAGLQIGAISRLVPEQTSPSFPQTLAETGAFTDLETLAPAAGLVPYALNLLSWSDNAIKSHWFSIPDTNQIIGFNPDGNWSFPTGTVWIQHLDLELTHGVPESRRRMETRFLVRNSDGVYGVTYRWETNTPNAVLVPKDGMDEEIVINENGVARTRLWRYPAHGECLACHTPAAGGAISFNTAQLNRTADDSGLQENQILALSRAGYLDPPVANVHTLRRLADLDDESVSLEYRVRSYLDANCAHCHQPHGPTPADWDVRITTPGAAASLIGGPLIYPDDAPASRLIIPGDTANSMLLTRIASTGPGRMPPIGSHVPDARAIHLISEWITNGLANLQSFEDWQIAFFGSTNAPDTAPDADWDLDGANNQLEYLTLTDPTDPGDFWTVSAAISNGVVQIGFEQIANRSFEVLHATSLTPPQTWLPLEAPGNEPHFSITNIARIIEDVTPLTRERYYRVRVSQP